MGWFSDHIASFPASLLRSEAPEEIFVGFLGQKVLERHNSWNGINLWKKKSGPIADLAFRFKNGSFWVSPMKLHFLIERWVFEK